MKIAASAAGHVLVVEDDDSLRRLVTRTLRDAGYTIREACDGDTALIEMRRRDVPLKVVLLDIVLPGLDGVAVAKAVSVERPDLVIVACSASLNESALEDLRSSGVRHFLYKPYMFETLIAAVRGACV